MVYRKYIENLINKNPVSIQLVRVSKASDGYGGFTENKKTLPAQTFTFYNRRSRREVISDTGVTLGHSSLAIVKLLGLGEADILEGDTFQHKGKKYKVSFVQPYAEVCKQIELEVIG